jgi:hypothetical protein
MLRKHLSYANVIASIALFIALGGSAVAAATLNRDSVGAPQIRKDAVRSPEIRKDAVRSPEIQKDAVRSSEIRDEDIKVADIATGAETALRSEVEVVGGNDFRDVPRCNGTNETLCRNILALRLNTHDNEATGRRPSPGGRSVEPESGRNWLVLAKFTIANSDPQLRPSSRGDVCGLVLDSGSGLDVLLDGSRHHLDQPFESSSTEAIALTAVFSDNQIENPRIALRCTEQTDEDLVLEDLKITALEVGKVIGP